MFPDFLPQEVRLLKNSESVELAKKIERYPISIPDFGKLISTARVELGTQDPPILLLHGFDSSLLEYRRLIPLLSSERNTWAVDLLGFGFTERPSDISYNPLTITKHLYHFWQTLIKRPVILVGASMGGATAIDFTLTHPEAVAKLVLINSVGYSGSVPLGRFLPDPMIELGVEFWRFRQVQGLFWGKNLGLLNSIAEDAIRCAILPSFMPGWHGAIADFTRSGGYYLLEKLIQRIDKPTLILWGERDDILGTEVASKFQKAIANSRLVWLQNAGHSPQWEQPESVAMQILEFIGSKVNPK